MKDFEELVRRSIRKDFAEANFKRNGRVPKIPHPKGTKRIIELDPQSEYYRFRKYLIGRLVRTITEGATGGIWVEFVNDADKRRLNKAAGWSEEKNRYLLQGVKFDD
jgi:hypothetical protein